MGVTVEELAAQVGGTLSGDPQIPITGAESIARARAGDITFAGDVKHCRSLAESQATAAVVPTAAIEEIRQAAPHLILIGVADPMGAFIEILQRFRPQASRPNIGVSPQAIVHPTAKIAEDCNIHPGVHIAAGVEIGPHCDLYPGVIVGEDSRIGANCVLYPNVVLYSRVTLGNRVMIHASAVLGADGFGYRFVDGAFVKIPQLGTVLVEDDVEIGACTTIDRGMIGPTVIGQGTKLDNLVMIAHNCELGRHNAFASQVGFAGSVTTGDYVRCGGQVGASGHVHLGTGSVYGARSAVIRDMPGGKTYLGTPVTEETEQIRMALSQRKLPGLLKQVRTLENQVAALTQKLDQLLNANDNDAPGMAARNEAA